MIELPEGSVEAYEKKMGELKWTKEGQKEVKAQEQLDALKTTTTGKKKLEPILKVIFKLNQNKKLKETVVALD